MDNSTIIGNIFYKITDSKPEQFRLLRFKESNGSYTLISLKTNDVIKVTKDTLKKDNYVLLRPDGYLTFNIVCMEGDNNQKTKDVIVCLHKREELDSGIPFAICRQCIQDFFVDNTLAGGSLDPSIRPYTLGCSICKDTCPQNINFTSILGCDKSESFKMVSIYINDDLSTIARYIFPGIHIEKYNAILRNLFNLYKDSNCRGLTRTVTELLATNSFMNDFDRAFGINNISFEYIPRMQLNYSEYNELCKLLHRQPIDIWSVYYDKDIDLKDIQREYAILRTPSKKLLVIAYSIK